MNKKAFLCLILSFVLVLTACNGGDTTDTSGGSSDFVFDTNVESFEGMTVKFGAWWNIAWPEEPRNEAEAPVVNAINQLESTKDVSFEYIKIDYDNYYSTIVDSIQNGNPVADLFWIESSKLDYFLEKELLIPFSYSTELDLTENKWDQFCNLNSIQYGYVYGVYWGQSLPGYVLYVNTEYVDMESVENAISQGTWNWDMLSSLAISAKEVGANGFGGDYLEAMLATNGADITDVIKANDRATAMLNYIQKMAAAGAIYEDDSFFQGNAAFYVGKANEKTDLDSKYHMVTLPKGPDAEEYISMTTDFMVLVMAKGTKSYFNLETALNLYTDIMWKYDTETYPNHQLEDVTNFFTAVGTKVYAQNIRDYDEVITPFMDVLLDGKTSTSQLLEMFRLEFSKYPVPEKTTDPSIDKPGDVG